MSKQPLPPLPPPLRGADPDSFPQRTITTRLPSIARRVLESNAWPAPAQARLQALIDEMPYGKLSPLDDPLAPDAAAWEQDFAPYVGQTWLEAPWFVVETFFFRRILQASGYYQPGPGYGVDPYQLQKRQEMANVHDSLHGMCVQLDDCREIAGKTQPKRRAKGALPQSGLARLLRLVIWGNQADRSMWPAGNNQGPQRPQAGEETSRLLVDHADYASRYLDEMGNQPLRVDFILDNGGQELAFDLALADFLLTSGLAQEIRFHAKSHPTYVSDATLQDVLEMVSYLQSSTNPPVQALVGRLGEHLASGGLVLREDYFWTSPLSGWQMPPELSQELGKADLLINKGDANYRRWLGDRHWPYTTPLEDILAYRPAPLLALRVLKANMIAGLPPGLSQAMDKKDPRWLYNGQWGVIQFVR